MRRHTLADVASGLVDDALAACVLTQPVDLVIHLGDAVRGSAAQFVKRTLDTRQRKVEQPCVIPNLSRVGAKHPYFAVVNKDSYDVVRIAFRTSKLQWVNGQAVKQLRNPNFLRAGFAEREIAVDVADRASAGEVRVSNLLEHVGVGVVDVTQWVSSDE